MKSNFGLLSLGVCGLLFSGASTAWAQEAAPAQAGAAQGTGIEDIVVTAEKRESTVQRTAATVMVQSGEQLVNQQILDITNLSKAVPSLTIAPPIVGGSIMYLRGVGTFSTAPNAQPGVAYVFDGVYAPREMAFTPFFDAQRIEVLPGPQGTLYGRNAGGGIVSVSVNRPTDQLEGSVLVEAGNYSSFHTTDMVNIPISDRLAVRGVVDYSSHDGYYSNGLNDADNVAGRFSVRYDPNDRFSLNANLTAYKTAGLGAAVSVSSPSFLSAYVPNADDPFYNPYPTDGLYNDQQGQFFTLNTTYDLDDVSVTYLLGYTHFDGDTLSQNGSFHLRVVLDGEFWSHELRLASTTDGPLQWLAGVYYYTGSSSQFGLIELPPAPGPDGTATQNTIADLTSYAAFGQLTYSLADNLRVTVGGRYSSDEMDGGVGLEQFANGPGPFGSGGVSVGTLPYGDRRQDERVDGKIGVEYDVAPDSLLYANVQTGYLQGGFSQVTPGIVGLPSTYPPATLIAYAAGSKNRFFDNRLQVNLEGFLYDYSDYQVIYNSVPFNANVSVPQATIYGAQLDVNYYLTDSTQLFLGLSALHTEFDAFLDPALGVQLDGFQLPESPNLSGTVGIEQIWDVADGATLTGRLQTYYNSGYWSTYNHEPDTHQGSYTKTDVSLAYARDDWSLTIFGDNLEDEAVYTTMAHNGAGEVISTLAQPQTFGVRFTKNFH